VSNNQWSTPNQNDAKRKFDLIKNAPKFEGKEDQDILVFLRGLGQYFESNEVQTDKDKYDLLRWVLEGDAQYYVSSLVPPPGTYDGLVKAINRRFCKNEDERVGNYYRLKQSSG
jgi:hypothetical protein